MANENQKWMLVVPPEGAARQVGEKVWEALSSRLPADRRKIFDTKLYLDAFDRMLKQPTDEMVVDLANQALVVQALDFGATHLLVLALSPITRFTLNLIRRQNVVTLHWFYEDFREAKYWKEVLPAYQHFIGIQKGPVEMACDSAGTQFHYLPTGFLLPPRPQVRPWLDRPEGIAFIGFPSLYRIEILEALIKAGLPLKVAGAGWEKYRGPIEACLTGKGWFGPEEAYKLLDASRIGLHLPSEDPRQDRANGHVSPRIFDIMAAGCVLLTEEAPLLRETLRGCDYRAFQGASEAVQNARTLLAEGYPLDQLTNNRDLILREHSFDRRITEILGYDP